MCDSFLKQTLFGIYGHTYFFFEILRVYCNIDLDYYTLIWMTLYGATKANRAKATGGHVHYNA